MRRLKVVFLSATLFATTDLSADPYLKCGPYLIECCIGITKVEIEQKCGQPTTAMYTYGTFGSIWFYKHRYGQKTMILRFNDDTTLSHIEAVLEYAPR